MIVAVKIIGSYKKKVQNVKGKPSFSLVSRLRPDVSGERTAKLGFFPLSRVSVAPNLNMSQIIKHSTQQ